MFGVFAESEHFFSSLIFQSERREPDCFFVCLFFPEAGLQIVFLEQISLTFRSHVQRNGSARCNQMLANG